MITSMVRKRDITTLWELDPLAAPPRSVQQQLRGTATSQLKTRLQPIDETGDDAFEHRCILELQLKFAMRQHQIERVRAISRELRLLEDAWQQQALHRAQANGELRVGDPCFALAKIVEWEWYKARLISVRSRYPTLKIEYLANLEGDSSSLALPQPRMNHVPIEHVRLDAPEQDAGEPIVPPSVACVTVIEESIAELS